LNKVPGREVKLNSNNRGWVLCIAIVLLLTLLVYIQTAKHEFINYDDPAYITANPHVQKGLTWESIRWAFTTNAASNWHPLTWLSHMLDFQLFGLNPDGHHLVNVALHLANTFLLFLVFAKITDSRWAGVFIAGVFALHPLHVESVAWAAERKDVLSTFFLLLTIMGYLGYCRKGGILRYSAVVVLFALGLMAKPMLVTIPFVLLLLDYWPIERFSAKSNGKNKSVTISSVVFEKLPLFVLTAISCGITFLAQKSGGAVNPIEPGLRYANVLVSYCGYIAKTFWPMNLAMCYPHPYDIQIGVVVASIVVLAAIMAACVIQVKRRPYLLVGYLWYLGTLVPVIGFIQVGGQSTADRYMYVPMIGISVMVAYLFVGPVRIKKAQKILVFAGAAVAICFFAWRTYLQVSNWKDSITLFQHAVNVTEGNHRAHNNLGIALAGAKRTDEAIENYNEVIRLGYGSFRTYCNLANMLAGKGKVAKAVVNYETALKLRPDSWQIHYNMGLALMKISENQKAIKHFRKCMDINPDFIEAKKELDNALRKAQKN